MFSVKNYDHGKTCSPQSMGSTEQVVVPYSVDTSFSLTCWNSYLSDLSRWLHGKCLMTEFMMVIKLILCLSMGLYGAELHIIQSLKNAFYWFLIGLLEDNMNCL